MFMASLAAALADPAPTGPLPTAKPETRPAATIKPAEKPLQASAGKGDPDVSSALDAASPQAPLPEGPAQASDDAVNPTLQRARARVIKIRRAPAEDGAPAPHSAGATPPLAGAQTESAALSPEAEADLMRELESVEAEQPRPASAKPQAPPPPVAKAKSTDSAGPVRPQRPVSNRRRASELAAKEEDASVKRLLDQANTEFEGTENRRRLSAIAHLKAAVAATVADRKSGGDRGPTEEMRMNPYRNDLERVVRARPAPATGPATKGADSGAGADAGTRPAPLILVSEQRIDTPRNKPSAGQSHITAVHPRPAKTGNLGPSDGDQENRDIDAPTEGTEARNVFGVTISFAVYAEITGGRVLAQPA
ncbi:hypothetical protein [Pseudorhodobacter sp.]|uniref:hypothetical protein n=1 Tax=Pseudorhodobacter sp. TaxID=1934400 RepID=UPI002AFEC8F9|nr:hypothetical protein [Pseudorhodobacter sp.]